MILNADVFHGINSPPNTINAHQFIDKSLELYPKGILSLGWTTTNNNLGNYAWPHVYEALKILTEKHLIKSEVEVTFAVRLLWSINSLNRLLWLKKFTHCSFTLWSHHTDTLDSLDSILLFRKYFHMSDVYYDLQPTEYEYFKANAYQETTMNKILNDSKSHQVRSFMKEQKLIDSNKWNTFNGEFYVSDYGALVLNNGARILSRKQFKVSETDDNIYEFSGNFEIFSLNKVNLN